MVKKLLLVFFMFSLYVGTAQQFNRGTFVPRSNQQTLTITEVAAYPNPFNFKTQITFLSSKNQVIEFSVKNLVGKVVFLKKVEAEIGKNSILFERNDLPNGMYIYSLQTDNEILSKRLVIK